MGNNRFLFCTNDVTKIKQRLGSFPVNDALQSRPPYLDTGIHGTLVVITGKLRPTGRAGIEPTIIFVFPMPYETVQECAHVRTARFIPRGHQTERRMIAVGPHNPLTLFVQPLVNRLAVSNACPDCAFDLEIQSEAIGGNERRLRWAPGMKTHMIHPVVLDRPHDLFPILHAGRRVSGEREHAEVKRPSEKRRLTIDAEPGALDRETAQTEQKSPRVRSATRHGYFHLEPVAHRPKFIP